MKGSKWETKVHGLGEKALARRGPFQQLVTLCPVKDIPVLPALGGLCVTPGDILFLCREGWASGRRLGFPSELTGLLYTKLLWLDTGMETGISKLGGGTACGAETREKPCKYDEKVLTGHSSSKQH